MTGIFQPPPRVSSVPMWVIVVGALLVFGLDMYVWLVPDAEVAQYAWFWTIVGFANIGAGWLVMMSSPYALVVCFLYETIGVVGLCAAIWPQYYL